MQNYINAILLFYVLTETDLYNNPIFITITIAYFLGLFVFRFIKFSIQANRNRENKIKNDELLSMVKREYDYGIDEIPEVQPPKGFSSSEFNQVIEDQLKAKSEAYLNLAKSKLK